MSQREADRQSVRQTDFQSDGRTDLQAVGDCWPRLSVIDFQLDGRTDLQADTTPDTVAAGGANTSVRTNTYTRTRTNARAHARTRAHTHTTVAAGGWERGADAGGPAGGAARARSAAAAARPVPVRLYPRRQQLGWVRQRASVWRGGGGDSLPGRGGRGQVRCPSGLPMPARRGGSGLRRTKGSDESVSCRDRMKANGSVKACLVGIG